MMDVELKVIKNELALSREENLMLHEKLDEILKEWFLFFLSFFVYNVYILFFKVYGKIVYLFNF